MRKTIAILAALLPAAWLWWPQPAGPWQADAQSRPPVDESIRQFRLVFGLTDTEPREWTGRVIVNGGELISLRGWRFSADDRAANSGEFRFKTKVGPYENQLNPKNPYGQTDWDDPAIRRQIPQGLIVRVRGSAATRVAISLKGAVAIEFMAGRPAYGQPFDWLEGNASIERLPVEMRLSEDVMQDDSPAVAVAPDGTAWTAWLSYQESGDWVVVGDGGISTRITEKGDHHSPAIAVLPNGWVLAAWSQREGQEFHVYTSFRVGGRWTPSRRMTTLSGSHIWPNLSSDVDGRALLVWQSLREGRTSIRMRQFDGRNWQVEEPVNQDTGNAWAPMALVAQKRSLVVWDSYSSGAYQVWFREWPNAPERVTVGDSFSVRPAVAVSPGGKVVVAWEESDPLWGKDFAYLTDRRGTTLYQNRRVRLAVRDEGMWRTLKGDPAESLPPGIRRFVQQPRIAFDAAGRLHMVLRCRTYAATARIDNWAAGGRWETFLTRREGDRWTPAILMPDSEGRNGMRAALAVDRDRVVVSWPTDHRAFPQVKYGDLDINTTRLAAVGAPSTLSTEPPRAPAAEAANPQPNENADVARMRAYRINQGGKEYRIVRGDLHRHTELSQDGSGDGSLDDLYRYTFDAAQMDYAHVADHQMGVDEEYNWWLTQKSNDLYFMPQRFVTLFGYERSVPYPNGHRNIIWPERGRPVLKIGAQEMTGAENSGPILYPYLNRTNGIATSHSSATQQGTDWRDQDSNFEPIAEIYQGFDSSYENAGAPRAWKEGDKTVHQAIRRDGYLWNAWAKGIKLGVQASSDHVSTHTSFACVLVDDFSRQGVVDGMRKRHTYAATDSIVLDYRIVTHDAMALMGDAVESRTAPRLEIRILGTAPIAQLNIIKNNTYVHQIKPGQPDVSLSYVDAAFGDGESYYYVRAQQTDGQLVWSSPIWVRRTQ